MKYNYRFCPICKSKKYQDLFIQKNPVFLKFVQCADCDFFYQNPILNFRHKNFYNKKIYFGAINIKSKFLLKRFSDIEREIGSIFNKKTPILDYGCGNGSFLNFLRLKKYKNLYGYDLNIKSGKYLNITFYDNLKKLVNKRKKFEVIILNHVLEHIINPIQILVFLKKYLLKKNGKIIIEVPNAILYEENGIKPGNLVKEHFSQFTIKSLFDCCLKAKLNIENIKTFDSNLRDPFIPSILIKTSCNKKLISNSEFLRKKIKNKIKNIKSKIKKLNKKKISLYGCGDGLDYFVSIFGIKNIVYLFDTNKKIISSKIFGKKVTDPKFIQTMTEDNIIIITSLSKKNSEIIKNKIQKTNNRIGVISF